MTLLLILSPLCMHHILTWRGYTPCSIFFCWVALCFCLSTFSTGNQRSSFSTCITKIIWKAMRLAYIHMSGHPPTVLQSRWSRLRHRHLSVSNEAIKHFMYKTMLYICALLYICMSAFQLPPPFYFFFSLVVCVCFLNYPRSLFLIPTN